jgi:hypothetical protein
MAGRIFIPTDDDIHFLSIFVNTVELFRHLCTIGMILKT